MGERGLKERLCRAILCAGAVAVGVARAVPTAEPENRKLRQWVAAGMNAGMSWMERHVKLREDLNNVLPGVRSVICAAFPYAPGVNRGAELPYISRYAYGPDYHEAIRGRLRAVLREMELDNVCRVCIDSAPVSERFWAVQAGIGCIGDNGALIVPGIGPEIFLAEILTTLELEPDAPDDSECLHCGACRRACPTGALQQDGTIDCRRCISYLTIEHRGPWTDQVAIEAMATPAGRQSLFGCDRCMTACPMNSEHSECSENSDSSENSEYSENSENSLLPEILSLTPENLPRTPQEFKARFRHTALMRTGLDGLRRNIANLKKNC